MRYFVLVLCLLGGRLFAQERGGVSIPYLIPQTIFVGDQGRLVVPLGRDFTKAPSFVREEKISASSELLIRRVELERRGPAVRLLVDFTAYAPGTLVLPPIDIPSEDGDLQIAGLELTITSILGPDSMILAHSAPPLAVPGTSLLIYGALGLVMLILCLLAGGALGGRRYFDRFREGLRRRYVLRSIERVLRKLRAEALRGNPGDAGEGELLARFSGAMRSFASRFTGLDCRAWTAGEFTGLFPELSAILRRSDTLRFSGTGIDRDDFFAILEDAWLFVKALAKVQGRGKAEDRESSGGILPSVNLGEGT